MSALHQFRRTVIAAMLGAAGFAFVLPHAAAQSPNAAQHSAKQAMNEAQSAARRDLAQFAASQLQVHGGGAPTDFPLEISDLQDLKDAVIGTGFPVYTIDPPELLGGRSSMRNLAKQTGQWRFMILLRDRPIGMATVERNNGRFETVAYGATVLSKDIDAVAGLHGNSDKSNLRLVRIYQARSDLLEVMGQDGRARYAPLHSARESLLLSKDGKRNDGLMDEADILQPLRGAVKQNMAASR